jgi:GNAT superfamily N-acetyltransferase
METKATRVGDVVIEEVDLPTLSDEDIAARNAFGNILKAESTPDDPPTPLDVTRARVRNIPAFYAVRSFCVRDPDGSIAAAAETGFMRSEENQHLIQAGIEVRPDRRGRGLAKALLRPVVEAAEAENRTLLMSSTSDRVPGGEAFARRVGAEPKSAMHTNRLVLADVDRDLVDRWISEGPQRAPGYTLFGNDGRYPDDLIEQVVDLHAVMNTAPRDDLDMEDERLTVEQARAWETSLLERGVQRWSLFARQDDGGALVGYTDVFYEPKSPETVHQGDTAVRPDHRGHALGKWLKAAMLKRVLEERPKAEDVRTGNADSNDAMLGINRQLGFEPFQAWTAWQVDVAKVRAYIDG